MQFNNTHISNSKFMQDIYNHTWMGYLLGAFQMILLTSCFYLLTDTGREIPELKYAIESKFLLSILLTIAFVSKFLNGKLDSIKSIMNKKNNSTSTQAGVDCLDSHKIIAERFLYMRGLLPFVCFSAFGGVFSILPMIAITTVTYSNTEFAIWISICVLTAFILFPKKSEFEKQIF